MSAARVEPQWGELRITALGGALLVVCAISWFLFSYGYIEDDGFIHLEFARSIAEGRGYAFNGHVVYGDTAPLWPLLLVAIHAVGFGWVLSAKLACIGGLLVAASGAWQLGRALAGNNPSMQLLPLLALLVTLINPYSAHWSFSGMETLAALGLSFWAISLGLAGQFSATRGTGAAVLLGIGPLLRPELILLSAIAGIPLLWRCWQASSRQAVTQRLAMLATLAVIMALPVLVWAAYAWHTFGALVPNTNRAKQGGAIAEIGPRLLSVYAVGFPVTLVLLPFVAVLRMQSWRTCVAGAVLLLWPLACIAFYLLDHTSVQTRYALLSMPCMTIAVLWLVATARPRWLMPVTAVMLLVAVVTISRIVVPHLENKQKYIQSFAAMSAFLRNHIPSESPVAAFAIGQIAFESRYPLVDIGGITDPSVIPHMANVAETLAWAKAHGARYYVSTEPPQSDAVPVFSAPAPYIGWTFQRSQYESQKPLSLYQLP